MSRSAQAGAARIAKQGNAANRNHRAVALSLFLFFTFPHALWRTAVFCGAVEREYLLAAYGLRRCLRALRLTERAKSQPMLACVNRCGDFILEVQACMT